MKRFLIAAALVLMGLNAEAGTITKEFKDLDSFLGIDISSNFDITLQLGKGYSVTAVTDTEMEQYLNVDVSNNVLRVSFKGAPTKLVNQLNSLSEPHPTLTITVPDISSIHLTGSCSLKSDDTFKGLRGDFEIFLNGASSIEKLSVVSSDMDINVSGTSKAGIHADCSEIDIIAAGLGSVTVSGKCNEYKVASEGSSRVTLTGEADELDCECKGTSNLNAELLTVNKADVECKGTATTQVNVQEELEVTLSGLSACVYKSDNDRLRVIPEVGRTASLKRL